jgi:hypothetical protein
MYILDLYCISPQPTFDGSFFDGNVNHFNDKRYYTVEPDYSELIPRGLLRRMGKAVRIGIGAGMPLVQKHGELDGIIIGTATGGLDDCIKFLNQIVDYDEGTLTPTNFVQSTPNSIAGHLALMSKNIGYNNTHMSIGTAFESALLDAMMLFENNEAERLLIGNVEENSDHNYNIDEYAGNYKKELVTSTDLLNSQTEGSVCGEGATMFVVSKNKEHALCKISDTHQFTYPSKHDIADRASAFLKKNNLTPANVDAVFVGLNGDSRSDFWYHDMLSALPECGVYTFKNLVGEHPTSVGFAT